MKKFTFKGVLDGFRQTVQPQAIRQEQEIQEILKPENFALKKTFRHGFPHSPTSFAFDPVQRLLAIGDKFGGLRILGRPGVDANVKHEGESECAVLLAEFIVNDGQLVTVTADDTIHLWNIRQKIPQVVQSLKFQRERVTCIHLPVASKWLYVGTEKGNIHVVNVETFALSGYVINWNKAIDVVRASHPGAVIGLCDNPLDANKILIAFECGLLVLWDLKGKFAEFRWQASEPVKSIAWHYEGKYFVSSHTDGSICSWPTRPQPKPQSLVCPHAKTSKDGSFEKCKPIYKVDLKASQSGDSFTIFSGGMPTEKGSKSNCITVMVGKSTTVLEMEHAVIDFITLCENPWTCETQEPYAIAVLLQYDLVLIDLLTPGFPCFESPYPMDLHESPVTCCTYLTDCPSDLVPAFYSVGRTTTSKKTGFSEREWPLSGGEWSPASCSYSEIVITGHQDGSLKFWDSGAGTLQILYKLKTAKLFEKPKNLQSGDSGIEHPLAIQLIYLCSESRRLCVAGSMGQVLLFKYRKVEATSDILVLEVPILFENYDDIYGTSPECDFIPHQVQKTESSDSDKTDNVLRVKSGAQRKPPGFQSQLVCLTTGPNRKIIQVTCLCINSSYGLMAYGTEYGLVVIDIIQKVCLLSVACPDLYGAHDPYSRTPKSPKRIEKDEQSRSPSSDQLHDTTSPDSPSIENITEERESVSSNQNSQPTNSSRPVSPDNLSKSPMCEEPAVVATSIGAAAATRQELPPDTTRRKSMSWKTFNLKRQLSKVNMKIGLNMGAAESGEAVPKSTAVFYTQKECSPEESESQLSTPTAAVGPAVECRESMTESSVMALDDLLDGGAAVGGGAGGCAAAATVETKDKDLFETMPEQKNIFKKVDFQTESSAVSTDDEAVSGACGGDAVTPTERPNNLPISSISLEGESLAASDNGAEAAGAVVAATSSAAAMPSKPPRQKIKEKRDQRLLSVPNIKYQMREMRTRTSSSNVGGGGSGTTASSGSTATNRNDASPSLGAAGGSVAKAKTHELSAGAGVSASAAAAGGGGAGVASAIGAAGGGGGSGGAGAGAVGGASSVAVIGSSAPLKSTFTEQASTSSTSFDYASECGIYMGESDKVDGSFSRSRSSSMSSIDMSSAESVTCLSFIESYAKTKDLISLVPTLWIGTSFGSILTLVVTMPEREVRKSQPVLVTINGGPVLRLKGSITSMSFLDSFGTVVPFSYEQWRDDSRDSKRDRTPTKSSSRTSPTFTPTTANTISSGGGNVSSSASSSGISGSVSTGLDTIADRQYIVIASEKQTKVYDIANQCCINRIQISEMDFAVKAATITMKGATCLATYLSNGHLMVHSLPSLKLLMDTEFLPLMDLSFQTKCKQGIVDPMLSIWGQQIIVHEDIAQISKIFCFSNKGHGLYMASPTEIQKFTISSEFCQFILEMMGSLYTVQEMPEQPKESFFKGLFGGGTKMLDREELFGEQSGKANRSTAKHIPGPTLDQLNSRASTAASEISRAHMLAMERGEKLNLLEERAERMANQAQDFSGTAHSLMLKYKDKKWYQL